MSAIKINNLNFSYDDENQTISDINLEINKGEFVTILGHNGSGKSTLAKLIIGLLKADSGDIIVDDILLTEDTVYDVRKKVGIVFQNPDNQFVGVTVKDDIAFGLENKAIDRMTMHQLIDKYSKVVSMDKFLDNNPETLSGGEKQRVAIAGVLAVGSDIIIFDESTSMLDPIGVNEVNDVIKSLKGSKTIIVITHNLREALNSDRVIIMNKGKIVCDGTPINVFKNKDILLSSNLDILDSMKLIEKINQSNIINKDKIEEALWELTFKM